MTDNDAIPQPYVLWMGDCRDAITCKTGTGVAHWRPDLVVGQLGWDGHYEIPGVPVIGTGLELEDVFRELHRLGARTLLNVCNDGRAFDDAVIAMFSAAVEAGLHVASGMHERLRDVPGLAADARAAGVRLHDFRFDGRRYPLSTNMPRAGRRLLTVGPDGAIGKKYTALSIRRAMRRRGVPHTFCATGQTGRLLCEPEDRWIVLDSVPVDFAPGAVEWLTPEHPDPAHWYVVEGQANPWHPAWSATGLSAYVGARPTDIVYCTSATRTEQSYGDGRGMPDIVRDVEDMMRLGERMGFETTLRAISLNAEGADREDYLRCVARLIDISQEHLGSTMIIDPNVDADVDHLLVALA